MEVITQYTATYEINLQQKQDDVKRAEKRKEKLLEEASKAFEESPGANA